MCGIVAYTGNRPAVGLLLDALRRLEYRGYDSAGIAVVAPTGEVAVRKTAGRIARLAEVLERDEPVGSVGIGHTRWATHGRPSDENAHPHSDCTGRVCVVHNGIVENYEELRVELESAGHRFVSQTDTEVIAHLIEAELAESGSSGDRLLHASRRALARVRGLYAIAVICAEEPRVVVGARSHAPLVVGLCEHGTLLASDIPAVLGHTRQVIRLADGDVAAVYADRTVIVDGLGRPQERQVEEIEWELAAAEKEGYPHFFLKEVYEQPEALQRTMAGRLVDGRVHLPEMAGLDAGRIRRVVLTGCGSAYHACLMARHAFEAWLGLPVEAEIGSELRYRQMAMDPSVLCVGVSQSGETADTLGAFDMAGERGAQRVAVTNAVGSEITSLADCVLLQRCGPEVAVVASKTFSAQVASLALLGLWLGRALGRLDRGTEAGVITALDRLPEQLATALSRALEAARIGEQCAALERVLFLGRGIGYPTALEGALKLKEISYIQAEGYPAGELRHGPLALVEQGTKVLVVATRSSILEKLIGNVEVVRARGGWIIALASDGDEQVADHADDVLWVPETHELLSPIVNVVPMQLLAYYAALARGCDVDKPRNLAKSVTVE